MKKIVLFSLFSLFVRSQVFALSEVEVSGELDVTASMWNLPTGERGNSAFNIPTLFLDLQTPLKDDNLLVLQIEGSEEKVSSSERFDLKLRQGYLDLVSVFEGMKALRVGLIPQVWQEAHYETWAYRFLGANAWSLTEKWKYLSYSDLGISYMDQIPGDLGEGAVTLSNGEGPREKEAGPHKEISFFFRFLRWQPWSLSLNYVRGTYERYGGDGIKERIQAMIAYRHEKWTAGLELLATQDPADAVRDFGMAEGVDVLSLSGRTVSGHAASLYATVSTGPLAEVMFRYDYLNAAVGETGKDLQTGMIALSYLVSEDIRGAILLDYTKYAEQFAPGLRDRSKLAFAAQVLF